ncbi:baseplate J/gp47 family protein [Nonomuraea jiangxiensis]|uniref:Putative baseplate assembly protein n=1 Tax=Nonomuraea jiangxiensis TaxID=633440 RepID=A0A1G9EXR2_9ACTN|nr:baseplate J/gp47 family protein [Nonomuraea jiangxiensis]SDK80870.1 putative baseplate assembly protein [Nonomuraea jiangxiensis]
MNLGDLRPGYVPEWTPGEHDPGAALLDIAARYLAIIEERLGLAPDKHYAVLLDLLGVRPCPARPASATVVVTLAEGAPDARLPAGTRLAAPPPPGGQAQISFETEQAVGLAGARLAEVVSLWPGRDQYVAHDPAGPLRPFDPRLLRNTPHLLYLAHDRLLDLGGRAEVTVGFDLSTPSDRPLDLAWEYWDGADWRPFLDASDSCAGLTRDGSYVLRAECAKSKPGEVDGVRSRWIRARLEETLPADPARVLPEVSAVTLSTTLTRSYASIWRVGERVGGRDGKVLVRLRDGGGVPLAGVPVSLLERPSTEDPATDPTDSADGPPSDPTGDLIGGSISGPTGNLIGGSTCGPIGDLIGGPTGDLVDGATDVNGEVVLDAEAGDTVVVRLGGFPQEHRLDRGDVTVTFGLDLAAPEQAVADGVEVDLSRPFHPLGVQPQPGAALYMRSEEALGRPGARVRVYLRPARTPEDELTPPTGAKPLPHLVSWEYFDGNGWRALPVDGTGDAPGAFRGHGFFELTVPRDLSETEVNGQRGRWLRARLLSGGYGVVRTLEGGLEFVVGQPPVLADLRFGYTWQDGPVAPETFRTYNDFAYGRAATPFSPVSDETPALYLGFDRKLPVDDVGLLLDLADEPDAPLLAWEYFDGLNWNELAVADGTLNLSVPGTVRLIGPEGSRAHPRFGESRHWLRARLAQDGPPGQPEVHAIHLNAVPVAQRQTVTGEPLGVSTGTPGQSFPFRVLPLLPGPGIEVRELSGRRAEVEWRALAATTSPPPQGTGSPRLVHDRLGRVTEVWMTWQDRPDLRASGPADRHFAVDHHRGLVLFGDGRHGMVPPDGAAVVATAYHAGGGPEGNLPPHSITQVLGAAVAIETVDNPGAADGGSSPEPVAALLRRGPGLIHARGRATTASDYAALALSLPAVAGAWAYPCLDVSGRAAAGWVTVVVIPHSTEPRPYPSPALREEVARTLAARAPATARLNVTGPDYLPVDVTVTLVPRSRSAAGAVEQAARQAINGFFQPRDGSGDVPVARLAALLEGLDGVDHLEELVLTARGVSHADNVPVPDGRLATAGDVRLNVIGG